MSTTRRFGTALLVACATAGAVTAAKPSQPVSVTSMISDYDTGVAPSLQIRSDQKGTYIDGSTTQSIITTAPGYAHAAGDWVLDTTLKRSTRTVYLSFAQPIPGSAPNGGDPPTLPSGTYTVTLKANCDLAGTNLLTMTGGSVANCPLAIVFTSSGQTYSLHMNPGLTTNGVVEWPETDYATVTCLFPSSGACSEWRFAPSGTYTPNGGPVSEGNRTKLLLGTANDDGGVDEGDFYLSFLMVVMK